MNFRRLLSWLARYFPPKHVADRFLPWLALITGLIGFIWALTQYGNDLSIERVKTTLALQDTYTEDFFKTKARVERQLLPVLREETCNFHISNRTVDTSGIKNPDCKNISQDLQAAIRSISLKGDMRAKLRDATFSALGHVDLDSKDEIALANTAIFFRGVMVCVQSDNCDQETSIALFAREMVEFVNLTCAFDKPEEEKSRPFNEEIAEFLFKHDVHNNIYWSLDSARENLFACDHLRRFGAD